MELRLEAPSARVPRVDPEHAVEDRQAFLQIAILDPKGGEDKEGIDVVGVRQEALPDQRCRIRTLNGHADTPSRDSRPYKSPPRLAPSPPPPVHPPEAARQERLEDRPGLIEARDPTVPVDERGTMGLLQGPLDRFHLREEIPRATAGDERRQDDVTAAEDGRLTTRERQLVEGRFRLKRIADELLNRNEHGCDEVVVFPQTGSGSSAEVLNQDSAPVHEEDLVDREIAFAEDRRNEDGREDGKQGECEDREDRREIGPERGRGLYGEEPLLELRTDGAVRHVLVYDGRVHPDGIADRRVGRDDPGEVHVDVLTRCQVDQDDQPGGRTPDFEQGTDADRDAYVVRGQVLNVRGVDVRRDDVRDVHDKRDPTSPHGRRGRGCADLQSEDADHNPDADQGNPRGSRAASQLDRLGHRNPRSAAGRVRVHDDRHTETGRATGAEEAALPRREGRVRTVGSARERKRDRRPDQDQIRFDREVHADELERTASRDVQPDRIRDRLVPLRGSAVRREGESVARRRGGGRRDPFGERGRAGVEQDCHEYDERNERETAHGTPVTMKCDAI